MQSSSRTQELIRSYERMVEDARRAGDRQREAEALNNLGAALTQSGQSQQALRWLNEALAVARAIDDHAGLRESRCLA